MSEQRYMQYPRTYLFVPGNRPERFQKAIDSGADAVILDLEDAVPADEKVRARESVCAWLGENKQAYVRINAADTPWFDADVAALVSLPSVSGIIVPKAANAAVLNAISAAGHAKLKLLPLIESAAGFGALDEIARARSVERLLFGTIDFQLDTGITEEGEELSYFRSQLTLASRLAGIAAPVDGVTTNFNDPQVIEAAARRARRFGFGAKLCIHPKQIAPIHAAFAPTAAEREWARRVLDAAESTGGAATAMDGMMVDLPVILRARAILNLTV